MQKWTQERTDKVKKEQRYLIAEQRLGPSESSTMTEQLNQKPLKSAPRMFVNTSYLTAHYLASKTI